MSFLPAWQAVSSLSFSGRRWFTENSLLSPITLYRCFPLELKVSISHTCWQQPQLLYKGKWQTQTAKMCLKERKPFHFLLLGEWGLRKSQENISIHYLSSEHNSQWFTGRASLGAQGHVLRMIKYTQLEVTRQTKALTIFRLQDGLLVVCPPHPTQSIMLLIILLDHQLPIKICFSSIRTY